MLSRREMMAFLGAGVVALSGVAASVLFVAMLRADWQGVAAAALVLLVGLPFALAAAMAAVPFYLVGRRLRRVSRLLSVTVGAVIGASAAAWVQMPSLPEWAGALVGGAAGWVWWAVARPELPSRAT